MSKKMNSRLPGQISVKAWCTLPQYGGFGIEVVANKAAMDNSALKVPEWTAIEKGFGSEDVEQQLRAAIEFLKSLLPATPKLDEYRRERGERRALEEQQMQEWEKLFVKVEAGELPASALWIVKVEKGADDV